MKRKIATRSKPIAGTMSLACPGSAVYARNLSFPVEINPRFAPIAVEVPKKFLEFPNANKFSFCYIL